MHYVLLILVFAIILKRKRKLVALLLLSYRCIITINVIWLFLTMPCVGLQCVIVVFPDHTHLLFFHHNTLIRYDCFSVLMYCKSWETSMLAKHFLYSVLKPTESRAKIWPLTYFKPLSTVVASAAVCSKEVSLLFFFFAVVCPLDVGWWLVLGPCCMVKFFVTFLVLVL